MMADDIKIFYLTHNGLHLNWSYQYNGIGTKALLHIYVRGYFQPKWVFIIMGCLYITLQRHTYWWN